MRPQPLAVVIVGVLPLYASASAATKEPRQRPPFSVVEATIPGLQAALRERRVTMKAQQLDALLFAGSGGAAIAARPGYPTVIVPFGLVPNAPTPAFPETFAARPSPYGVSFSGLSCSEPRLLALAYAFEQATKRRVPPASAP